MFDPRDDARDRDGREDGRADALYVEFVGGFGVMVDLCERELLTQSGRVDARTSWRRSTARRETRHRGGPASFAERILPRASDLWVQASLDYKQRLQQLFFPEGIAYNGNRFNRTAATAPLFNYLAPSESADEKMVSRGGIEPPTRRLRVCCSAN